ncbi:MAG: ubiquinone/menaquinone biosynthesis methyltransferase [Planctomycetia bacterium]|nr:ubiquinone/menaquinone biosynthesis methyltransferase [Planctomycetia bacterium]
MSRFRACLPRPAATTRAGPVIADRAATIEDPTRTNHGATPEPAGVDKSGDRVRGMFAEIAPRYDLVNRLLSGGIDVLWRRTTVRRAPPPPLALAYAAKAEPAVRIVASDFCRPMLDRGEVKAAKAGRAIEWVEADAMRLPFDDAAFDLVTVAFGLRNIADTSRGLAEMARVTKPGGKLAILEFSLPRSAVIRAGYLWYFRNVLPRLGNAVARNGSDAYTYLNQSVEEFPSGERLAALVRAAGYDAVELIPLTFGIATLTIATRTVAPSTTGAARG